MNTNAKLLRIIVPAVTGVGLIAALVLGRAGDKRIATLPRGIEMVASLDGSISTDRSRIGDAVELRTVQPIRLGANASIAEGARLRGTVTRVKPGGRITGAPVLALKVTELEIDGKTYPIATDAWQVRGKSDATEPEIGGGAVATKGDQLTLGAGQLVRIRLAQPVTVQYRARREGVAVREAQKTVNANGLATSRKFLPLLREDVSTTVLFHPCRSPPS